MAGIQSFRGGIRLFRDQKCTDAMSGARVLCKISANTFGHVSLEANAYMRRLQIWASPVAIHNTRERPCSNAAPLSAVASLSPAVEREAAATATITG